MSKNAKKTLALALPAAAILAALAVPHAFAGREASLRPSAVPLSGPGGAAASEEKAALEQARARTSEAEADLRLAEAEVARARQLLEGMVGSRQALDRAERDQAAAFARRATSRADAERLSALVSKSRIVSPIEGVVVQRHVSAGETVIRGDKAFRVADLSRLRIEAEVDESESGRVRPGAPVALTLEEAPGREWKGHVEEIPDSVQPRRTKPQDPGKPVDTRVLLVKVALDSPAPLKLGRRVEVAIEAGSGLAN